MNLIDRSNLRQVIIDFPDQFKTGISLARKIKLDGNFKKITISGMGGSALPGDLLKIYCDDLLSQDGENYFLEITVNRYYTLPYESYTPENLNIIASYSGNTEETISSLEEIRKRNLPFMAIASGGKLEKLSQKYKMPFIKLPSPNQAFQPRMATGYFFGVLIQILINQNLIPDISSRIISEAEKLKIDMDKREKEGMKLSDMIQGKTPVIYASSKYKSIAMVWKIKINENAKTPAFFNFLPEADHNEMVGFTLPQGKFFVIMLKDPSDDPRNQRRFKATSDIIAQTGVDSYIIDMEGKSVFEKMFKSISLADWTSYYLALSYNQDPTPVESVEKLKKILAS